MKPINYFFNHSRVYEQDYFELNGQFSDKFINKYNLLGMLVKAIHYDKNNKVFQKTNYYYSGKKRIKAINIVDGKILMTMKYIYRNCSNILLDKIMYYDNNNFNYGYSIMHYDNEKWIGYDQYLDEIKQTDNYIFVYDDNNKIIKTIKNGKIYSSRIYNEKGQLNLIMMTDGFKIELKWEDKKSKYDVEKYLLY
jgi:hypothetical protein